MKPTYAIIDEPRPSPLSQLAVDPLWPLLAMMLGGAWLSYPWFVVNAFAVGSPTMRRELAIVAAAVGATALWHLGLDTWLLDTREGVAFFRSAAPYLLLVGTLFKLGAAYWLYALQSHTFHIYRYYGGVVRNGIVVVAAGLFLRGKVVGALFGHSLLLGSVLA